MKLILNEEQFQIAKKSCKLPESTYFDGYYHLEVHEKEKSKIISAIEIIFKKIRINIFLEEKQLYCKKNKNHGRRNFY